MEANLFVAFSLGVLSTLHCWGMCGGIVSALTISMGKENSLTTSNHSILLLILNLGRISSYILAGIIAGLLGQQIEQLMPVETGHMIMKTIAGVILVLIGLHLTGWFSFLKQIEAIGINAWKHIQPLGKHFIPINTKTRAYMMGMIWGWLPCALVYSVLLWTMTSGSVIYGSLIMLSFGLGTLPSMYMAGFAGSSLYSMPRRQAIRKVAGIIIIIFGLVSPFIGVGHHAHGSAHISHHK